MMLKPSDIKDLQTALRNSETPIDRADLSALDQLIEHVPEDMTTAVQGGMTLGNFQSELSKRSQWLPVDPPSPEVTIADLLGQNLSGPRRFGCGTLRDWLIGISVVLPDGRLIRNGGKVVKNVAGFDLCKLFIGSRGALGVIVEATFKLSPQPEKEIFLGRQFDSLDAAGEMIDVIWDSDLRPSALDLHQLEGKPLTLVFGLSGIAADVDAQLTLANSIGLNDEVELVYNQVIHAEVANTTSMLPSRLIQYLKDSAPQAFVARAGNGIVYVPRFNEQPKRIPSVLEKRIKELFDPNGKLPAL